MLKLQTLKESAKIFIQIDSRSSIMFVKKDSLIKKINWHSSQTVSRRT